MSKSARHDKFVVAIDGPAGSGKSSVAKALAAKIGVPYLDTGAMYRALTWYALHKEMGQKSAKRVPKLLASFHLELKPGRSGIGTRVWVNGQEITADIRRPELTREVHWVASIPAVREFMVEEQRRLAGKSGGVVEGRDIGTVVFPNARYKFYLDASLKVRSHRRYMELRPRDPKVVFSQILRDQRLRDARDRGRAVGALKRAKDAVRINTSALTVNQTVDKIRGFMMAELSKKDLAHPIGEA